jgi:hypothetical protein
VAEERVARGGIPGIQLQVKQQPSLLQVAQSLPLTVALVELLLPTLVLVQVGPRLMVALQVELVAQVQLVSMWVLQERQELHITF